jgi:hypothetical protein
MRDGTRVIADSPFKRMGTFIDGKKPVTMHGNAWKYFGF